MNTAPTAGDETPANAPWWPENWPYSGEVALGDLIGPYPALLGIGPLAPRFSRDVALQMARDLAIACNAFGSDEWTTLDVRERDVVVEYWAWRADDEQAHVVGAELVEPDAEGFYRIGADWAWSEAPTFGAA
jgi:hypothetical protein